MIGRYDVGYGVGDGVGDGVGVGEFFGVGDDEVVKDSAAVIVSVPVIVAVVKAEVAFANSVDPVVDDHERECITACRGGIYFEVYLQSAKHWSRMDWLNFELLEGLTAKVT